MHRISFPPIDAQLRTQLAMTAKDVYALCRTQNDSVQQTLEASLNVARDGESAFFRYPWQNVGEPAPRMKLTAATYFAPWDWVIGASAYEDENAVAKTEATKGLTQLLMYALAALQDGLACGGAVRHTATMTMDELVAEARKVVGEFPLGPTDLSAGSVGAALLSASGRVYTGICIDVSCGMGFCAEHAAVAEMLKARETRIAMAVAVCDDGTILPPCGRCRELMLQIDPGNRAARVIVGPEKAVELVELLPHWWMDAWGTGGKT